MSKKKLFTFIDVDENTPIVKLSVMDQIRVVIKKMAKDEAAELKADDAVTKELLRLKANLMAFLDKSLSPLRNGKAVSVTLQLPDTFEPVLDDVLTSSRYANFYTIQIRRPEVNYDVKYNIVVVLTIKQ